MKSLLFVLLIIPTFVHAAVYKCTVNGQTVYQQTPCAGDGDQMDIKSGTSSSESGLRESERKMIEDLNKTSSEEPQSSRSSAGIKSTRSCKGIRVISFKSYTDDTSYQSGDIGKNQCALTKLVLDDYFGKFRTSAAEEMGSRFYARFIDEKTYSVRTFVLMGPERVSPANNRFTARICFGESNYDIEQVGCR